MSTEALPVLSPDERHILGRAARRELARRDGKDKKVLDWGRRLFPHKFSLKPCVLHDHIVEHRLDELNALEAPRNHAKSTIGCFLNFIFGALEEPNIFSYYLNVQATEVKALASNRAIMTELESNEDLQALYDYDRGAMWNATRFVLKINHNGRKYEVIFGCASVGQSIRGIQHNNLRPDYIELDDLYNEDDINNPDSTVKKNDWFWSTLYPARAKHKRNAVHVQGTPANREDLLKSLEDKPRWGHKRFAAITDYKAKTVLWPELNTFESLMADLKDMPPTIWHREMMCERRDEDSALIKGEWLESWEYDPANLKFDHALIYVACVLSIDPSIGKKEENDPSAYALVIKAQRNDGSLPIYYIEALCNKQMTLQERIDKAKEYTTGRPAERPVTLVKVETIAGFKDFGDLVAANISVGCEMVDKVPDKITHLEKKSHYFQNHRVYINKNIDPELRNELHHQLTTNHPRHDDIRDAVLHALDDESSLWTWASANQ